MEGAIWCGLPEGVLDRVIAFLPAPSFFRSRSVCKRWYSLLFSPSFLELYLQLLPRHQHCFLFFSHNPRTQIISTTTASCSSDSSYLFDPYTLTWHRLTFPLIPPGFSPAASSAGLLIWVSDHPGPKSLFLHNPLHNASITHLPLTLTPRLFPSLGLSVSADYWSSLDILVAGDDMVSQYAVKNLTAETFRVDARGLNAWTQSPLPRLCTLQSSQMTYCHLTRRFYCMDYSPFAVLSYDVAASHWTKLQAPMRRFLRSPSLVESTGEVVLVAAVEKSKLNVPRSLRMWRLSGSQWVEVERMPQQMYQQFEEAERGNGFDCVGHGEFIVITIRMNKAAVLFDARSKRWMSMPPCPFLTTAPHLHGFAYEPRLATPVTALLDHHFALNSN